MSRILPFVIVISVGAVARAQPGPTDRPPEPPADPAPPIAPEPEPPTIVVPTPAPAPVVVPPPEVAPVSSVDVAKVPRSHEGFYILSADGSSRLRVGGIIQFDGRFFVNDTANTEVDQFVFRSIRPDLQGTVYDHFDFRLYPDFAGAKLVVQEAYTDIHYGEAMKVRVGKFKVPFGLERLQNEYATTFVDRGLPTQLAPNRDLGVQVFGLLARGIVEYEFGIFNGVADGSIGDGDVSDDKELAARVFLKPFVTGSSPLRNLGFGAATTFGDKAGTLAQTDVAALKTQAQSTLFQYYTGTTLTNTVVADGRHWRATAQGYWYTGPFGVLAEYVRSVEHVALNGTNERASLDSWQVFGQWVVTGEDATFNSVTPRHPFDPANHQWGAFDIAARVTELRVLDPSVFDEGLADPTTQSRRTLSVGGGFDWFPNRVFRFALDFDHTSFELPGAGDHRPSEISIIGRAQTAF